MTKEQLKALRWVCMVVESQHVNSPDAIPSDHINWLATAKEAITVARGEQKKDYAKAYKEVFKLCDFADPGVTCAKIRAWIFKGRPGK